VPSCFAWIVDHGCPLFDVSTVPKNRVAIIVDIGGDGNAIAQTVKDGISVNVCRIESTSFSAEDTLLLV
jgi:hypothetical protein